LDLSVTAKQDFDADEKDESFTDYAVFKNIKAVIAAWIINNDAETTILDKES